jgi:hypothetical protein
MGPRGVYTAFFAVRACKITTRRHNALLHCTIMQLKLYFCIVMQISWGFCNFSKVVIARNVKTINKVTSTF